MGKQVKIFCINCKYYHYNNAYSIEDRHRCVRREEIETTDDLYRPGKTCLYKSNDSCKCKNKDNDCIQYRRKWWKFWIHPKRMGRSKLETAMLNVI